MSILYILCILLFIVLFSAPIATIVLVHRWEGDACSKYLNGEVY